MNFSAFLKTWAVSAWVATFAFAAKPPDRTSEKLKTADSLLATIIERVMLPGGASLKLVVDPVHERLELRGSDLGAVAKALEQKSTLCPTIEKKPDALVLKCVTRQLAAKLSRESGALVLDIRRLRGVAIGEGDDLPMFSYEPTDFGWGNACPGSTPLGRAECLLRDPKNHARAKEALQKAVTSLDRNAASLRLGQLYLHEGNAADAFTLLVQAGKSGPIGKLAQIHLCEINGNCVVNNAFRTGLDPLSDTANIPEPGRTEAELRMLRLRFYGGETDQVFLDLDQRMALEERPPVCRFAQSFCELLVTEALKQLPNHAEALNLFLRLQSQAEGPLGVSVTTAAAEVSDLLGAPQFGANILAAASPRVDAAALPAHLLRTAQLYVESGDRTRADTILVFARQKLGGTTLAQRPWVLVQRAVSSKKVASRSADSVSGLTKKQLANDSTEDLARALTAASTARRISEEQVAP